MESFIQLKYIISSIIYSLIGIVILVLSFWAIEKLTPENLWEEIIVKHNNALAIIGGAFIIAIAIIIASAIHG